MPAPRSPHRKASDRNPSRIDIHQPAEVLERFEDIGLSRKLEGVAVPAKGVQHESVCRGVLARFAQSLQDKRYFRFRVASAVQPHIHSPRLSCIRPIVGGHDQPVGLHRIIDVGDEAADKQLRLIRRLSAESK